MSASSTARETRPVFLDPVSTAYARRAAPLAGRFYGLKPNSLELAVLAGMDTDTDEGVERAAASLAERGAKCVAVSLGERGCYFAGAGGERFYRALRPVGEMRNATGAGDAFLAGLVYGFVNGMSPEDAVDLRPRRRAYRRRERRHDKPGDERTAFEIHHQELLR